MSTQTIDLETLVLAQGNHASREFGMCFMEAAAYVAGEPHSDHPECVSPVIGAFMRRWNDDLGDAERQKLKPYIRRVVGTRASDELEERRAWLVTDWMVRVHTPAWLELAGLKEQAAAVRALGPVLSTDGARTAQPALESARSAAAAAWDAARAAAGAAAGDAARAAAGAAAGDAARAAAGAAARDAARASAWASAWDAAWDAAWASAWAAAQKALAPTVLDLQASAFKLLDALIEAV